MDICILTWSRVTAAGGAKPTGVKRKGESKTITEIKCEKQLETKQQNDKMLKKQGNRKLLGIDYYGQGQLNRPN